MIFAKSIFIIYLFSLFTLLFPWNTLGSSHQVKFSLTDGFLLTTSAIIHTNRAQRQSSGTKTVRVIYGNLSWISASFRHLSFSQSKSHKVGIITIPEMGMWNVGLTVTELIVTPLVANNHFMALHKSFPSHDSVINNTATKIIFVFSIIQKNLTYWIPCGNAMAEK